MRLSTDTATLTEALGWVTRFLPPSRVPILNTVLLEAAKKRLSITGFDGDTGAKVHIDATVEEAGKALVSGHLLADIAKTLPGGGTVSLATGGTGLEVVCGGNRFTLQTLPDDEYPPLPQMPPQVGVVAGADLAGLATRVGVAAGKDDMLPVYQGVQVEAGAGMLRMTATDRYRAATGQVGFTAEDGAVLKTVAPWRVLRDVARAVGDAEVTLCGDGHLIGFRADSREVVTRLLDAELPSTAQVFAIKDGATLLVDTAELASGATRARLVSERNTPMTVTLGDGEVVLEAATGDMASGEIRVDAVIDVHPGEGDAPVARVGVNPGYLLDALAAVGARYTKVTFGVEVGPCWLQGVDSPDGAPDRDGYLHVIMLMRLGEREDMP